jgi:hypothetical protein
MENRKRPLSRVLAVLVALIALAYVVALLRITVVKGTTLSRIVENMAAGRAPLRSVNLVPFETVLTYLRFSANMPFLRWFSNIFGNMLVFVARVSTTRVPAPARSTSRLEAARTSWPERPSGCGAPSGTACW